MLHELQAFLHTVDAGSITGAARLAHLTQPALSAAIQRLEQEMAGDALVHELIQSVRAAEAGRKGRAAEGLREVT